MCRALLASIAAHASACSSCRRLLRRRRRSSRCAEARFAHGRTLLTRSHAPTLQIKTSPFDPRFPTTNQAKNCFTRYNEFHKCAKSSGRSPEPPHVEAAIAVGASPSSSRLSRPALAAGAPRSATRRTSCASSTRAGTAASARPSGWTAGTSREKTGRGWDGTEGKVLSNAD